MNKSESSLFLGGLGCQVKEISTNETKNCIFPFVFGRKIFNGCTQIDDDPVPWCSTHVDDNGILIKGMYGYCGNECSFNEKGGELVILMIRYHYRCKFFSSF